MVSITHPGESRAELDRMTRCAEGILEALGLPYRTVVLCTGDMGFGARRTHDIEVWLPGQGKYREISSVFGRRALPDCGAGERATRGWLGRAARGSAQVSGREIGADGGGKLGLIGFDAAVPRRQAGGVLHCPRTNGGHERPPPNPQDISDQMETNGRERRLP